MWLLNLFIWFNILSNRNGDHNTIIYNYFSDSNKLYMIMQYVGRDLCDKTISDDYEFMNVCLLFHTSLSNKSSNFLKSFNFFFLIFRLKL